jgi:two-component system sensor histidine kinase MprB
VTLDARRDRVVRAVNNLINNAIKFTPAEGTVSVRVDETALCVDDSGPGVAEEDRPFVFERFWRSSRARALPGSGLGLAIVAQVAHEIGGRVSVEQSPTLGGASILSLLGRRER